MKKTVLREEKMNKVINLTIEYIDQISLDGKVTGGLIKSIEKNIIVKRLLRWTYMFFKQIL